MLATRDPGAHSSIASRQWLKFTSLPGAAARVVAFAGDGGFQTIPQAFSTLARKKTSAIVFVFDNGLYGIEQFLIDQTYYPAFPRWRGEFEGLRDSHGLEFSILWGIERGRNGGPAG